MLRQRLVNWVLVCAMATSFVGVVLVGVLKPFDYHDGWGCKLEQLGVTSGDFVTGGGAPDPLSAVREWIPSLAQDGAIPADELEAALENQSGMSSYDPKTGVLTIDGLIQAKLVASQQPGGGWRVGKVEHCFKPPDQT